MPDTNEQAQLRAAGYPDVIEAFFIQVGKSIGGALLLFIAVFFGYFFVTKVEPDSKAPFYAGCIAGFLGAVGGWQAGKEQVEAKRLAARALVNNALMRPDVGKR